MEKIKVRVNEIYDQIKELHKELKDLRSQCLHKNTHEGLYGNDVAHAYPSIICSDCGECLGPADYVDGGYVTVSN